MTKGRKIGLGILVLLLLIQFIRREKNINPDVNMAVDFTTVESVPANVVKILEDACYDCHSSNTVYPWYAEVAPLSWWLQMHVNGGKQHLNFNEWGTYGVKKRNHKIEECYEMMENNSMPLKSYTWMHSEAKLSEEDRAMMINFFKSMPMR